MKMKIKIVLAALLAVVAVGCKKDARTEEIVVASMKPVPAEETVVYRYEPKRPLFTIEAQGPHRWKVVSDRVDRLAEQTNLDDDDSAYQFAVALQRMGIDNALREKGAVDGDQVIIGSYIMDFKE